MYISPEFQIGQVYDGTLADPDENILLYRPVYVKIASCMEKPLAMQNSLSSTLSPECAGGAGAKNGSSASNPTDTAVTAPSSADSRMSQSTGEDEQIRALIDGEVVPKTASTREVVVDLHQVRSTFHDVSQTAVQKSGEDSTKIDSPTELIQIEPKMHRTDLEQTLVAC